jgi:hypothetical protein
MEGDDYRGEETFLNIFFSMTIQGQKLDKYPFFHAHRRSDGRIEVQVEFPEGNKQLASLHKAMDSCFVENALPKPTMKMKRECLCERYKYDPRIGSFVKEIKG